MHEILNKNLFLVKEHTKFFKASNNYDIYDPVTNQVVLHCREKIGFFTKLFRFTDYKRMTPFNIIITTPEGKQVLRISRGISLFVSKVDVFDESDNRIGGFKQKFFSLGGSFNVLDKNDNLVCTLKSINWKGWEFRFSYGTEELASVSKKWGGLGKELFTTADNYILQINDKVPAGNALRELILGSVMCIDMVLKE